MSRPTIKYKPVAYRPWTEEERQEAAELIRQGVDDGTFENILQRSRRGYRRHLYDRNREKRLRDDRNVGGTNHMAASKIEVPDELIEDARRRLMAPKTITATIMGDPPPGQSALDRKRGIA